MQDLQPAVRNGRPQWPDVLAEIRASEMRVRADILDLKSVVADNRAAIANLELNEARREQATKDWFRTGNAIRTLLLLAVALGGLGLGVINYLT
jgi:hypothetical protein